MSETGRSDRFVFAVTSAQFISLQPLNNMYICHSVFLKGQDGGLF